MRKGTKRITVVVTAQSYYHLRHLADMAGYNSIGRVIDKLVREHQLAMRGGYTTEKPNEGERPCRERTDRHPTKKDPMKQYQGAVSRAQGKHFEEYIDLSLRYYEQRGEAVVEKTPEPMRPTKDLGNGKFIAYYEKAAQPDYKGTLKGGRAVVFEAKYSHPAQMEQSRVTREQAARLDDHLSAGAMCFVVAGFGNGDVFRIPWEVWRDMKTHFGHKYATPEELEAYKVPLGRNGVLLLLD